MASFSFSSVGNLLVTFTIEQAIFLIHVIFLMLNKSFEFAYFVVLMQRNLFFRFANDYYSGIAHELLSQTSCSIIYCRSLGIT